MYTVTAVPKKYCRITYSECVVRKNTTYLCAAVALLCMRCTSPSPDNGGTNGDAGPPTTDLADVDSRIGDTEAVIDDSPPTWSEDVELLALSVREDGLPPSRDMPVDPSGIEAYVLYKDGVLLTSLSAAILSLEVNQLSPATTYTFRVEAEDKAGNVTSDGPAVTVTTIDQTAPTWAADAQLTGTQITDSGLRLGWCAAFECAGPAHVLLP